MNSLTQGPEPKAQGPITTEQDLARIIRGRLIEKGWQFASGGERTVLVDGEYLKPDDIGRRDVGSGVFHYCVCEYKLSLSNELLRQMGRYLGHANYLVLGVRDQRRTPEWRDRLRIIGERGYGLYVAHGETGEVKRIRRPGFFNGNTSVLQAAFERPRNGGASSPQAGAPSGAGDTYVTQSRGKWAEVHAFIAEAGEFGEVFTAVREAFPWVKSIHMLEKAIRDRELVGVRKVKGCGGGKTRFVAAQLPGAEVEA